MSDKFPQNIFFFTVIKVYDRLKLKFVALVLGERAATIALGVISIYIFVKTVKYNWEPRYRNLNILFVLVLQTVVFIYVRIL